MKLEQWVIDRYGRDRLQLAEGKVAEPQAGEVLVEVGAVSLNYRDQLVIDGVFANPQSFPFVPASDMAGKVIAAGPGVTRFKAGDRVISTYVVGWIDGRPLGNGAEPYGLSVGGPRPGMLSRYVTLPADWLIATPDSLDDNEASTLPIAGVTAWNALVELGHVRAGETVVLQGTGGVSLFGLQIARAHGADAIITSAEDDKLARAAKLGATHGINRKSRDWVKAVLDITGNVGAQHILEIVGGSHLGKAAEAASVGGRISVIGIIDGMDLSVSAGQVLLKQLVIQGIYVGSRRVSEDFAQAVDRLKLKPVIEATYGLKDVPAALDHLVRGPFGKVVVDFTK